MNIGFIKLSFATHTLQITFNVSVFFFPCIFLFPGHFFLFVRVIPPVLPECSNPESCTDSFFKIEPSEISSGCFLAVIAREVRKLKFKILTEENNCHFPQKECINGTCESN